ncbi:hypothetical protein VNO77_41746 [Canavalia gladiata]|uniref:Uncharacterized protein n=1 Tax=Canavalia gladiata TaxID=3824 RepID=A0AAN9PS31_CANGL
MPWPSNLMNTGSNGAQMIHLLVEGFEATWELWLIPVVQLSVRTFKLKTYGCLLFFRHEFAGIKAVVLNSRHRLSHWVPENLTYTKQTRAFPCYLHLDFQLKASMVQPTTHILLKILACDIILDLDKSSQ